MKCLFSLCTKRTLKLNQAPTSRSPSRDDTRYKKKLLFTEINAAFGMLGIWRGHAAHAVITIAQKFDSQHIMPLRRLVETTEQIVQGLHQFSYWQRYGKSREIHHVRVQDAHIVVRLHA